MPATPAREHQPDNTIETPARTDAHADTDITDTTPVRPGDIGCCFGGSGIISKLISLGTADDRGIADTPSHIWIGVEDNQIIEAQKTVQYQSLHTVLQRYKKTIIYRPRMMDSREKQEKLIRMARAWEGTKYSYFQIWRQMLDNLFRTNRFTAPLSSERVICSEFAVLLMFSVHIRISDIPAESATPDDVFDYLCTQPLEIFWRIYA